MSESSLITLDIGGESDEAVSAINAVGEAFQQLAGAAEEAGSGSSGAAGSMEAAGGAASEASGGGDTFAATLSTIGGEAATLSPALAPVGNAMRATGQSMREVSEAGGLAGVGLAGLAGIAAAAVGVLAGLGTAGANNANEIMRLSAVMGMSEAETQKWSIAMEMSGGNASALARAVLLTGNAAQTNAGAFAALGVQTKNVDGSMQSAGAIFQSTISALAGLGSASEQSAAAAGIFGTRFAAQLIPLISHYNEIMPQAAKLTSDVGGAEGDAAQKAIEYNVAMTKVKEEVAALGGMVLPALVAALSGAAAGVKIAIDAFNALAPIILAAVDTIKAAKDVVEFFGNALGGSKMQVSGYEDAVKQLASAHGLEKEALQMTVNAYEAAGEGADGAGSSAANFAGAEDKASGAAGGLSAALEKQINSLGMTKYGFESSVQGIENHIAALEQLTAELGSAAQAQAALASMMGQTVTISSSGQTSISGGRASGGPVERGKAYLVGEEGVELFAPSTDGYIYPNSGGSPSRASGGGGASVMVIYNQNGPVFGTQDLRQQVLDFIKDDALSGATLRGYLAGV